MQFRRSLQGQSAAPGLSTGHGQDVQSADGAGPQSVKQSLTPPVGSHWRARYEARRRAIADDEETGPRTEGGTEEEEIRDAEGSLADSSSEDGEGSEEEGNPLVKMKPGYVYDKMADRVRKRTMTDGFIDEKHRRLRERRKKRQRKK